MSTSPEFTSLKAKNKETWATKQYEMVMKQYEMLINSISNSNSTRDTSNNFWITVNAFIISGAAYVRDTEGLSGQHKYLLMWTLVILGLCLCISWINYLATLKKNIDEKNKLLIELENYFPIDIFTSLLITSPKKESSTWGSLTTWVISVPFLFLLGYVFFLSLLLFFPYEIAASQK